MMKVYDLFCGLGGWAEGFLAEGYDCVGFDIEAHDYGTGGYPGTLILRDVRSIHGSELKDATCIVASPPCQAYSYRAMPWKKAKALPPPDNTLFNECFRIQREASEAAGHYIPMVVENVRGAQKWVGRASAHYGSYYLWGDVGMVGKRVIAGPLRFGLGVAPADARKVPGFRFDGSGKSFQTESVKMAGLSLKPGSGKWRSEDGVKVGNSSARTFSERRALAATNPEADPHNWWHGLDGTKQGGDWFGAGCDSSISRKYSSRSLKRKMASAMIAKIPYPLAQHIARSFREPL